MSESTRELTSSPSHEEIERADRLSRIESLLTEERFAQIVELFNFDPEVFHTLDRTQCIIEEEGNKLRSDLGLPKFEVDRLECAGFVPFDNPLYCDGSGNPNIIDYITGEEKVLGHALKTSSGPFVVDPVVLRTVLIAFCMRDNRV